ncbi:MAG: protein kinase [Deltaproteobacteria bacterium]|nr:protein kinase [Deltaproteobacteria bacterium]
MPAVATDESMVGFVLADKYKIQRVIGKGGMGIVYEAQHMALGKRVAIKLMLDKYFEDHEAKARFSREAYAASQVGSPHIIDVVDIGSLPDGRSYVVMELLNGKPLADVLEQGPMPPWRAISIMKQVLRAVGAAHARGVIHRDLKPDNIFLIDQGDNQDFVKLLDFGISKVLDPDEQIAFTKLTTTGVVMGTPLYMAPEQAMGQPAGAGADIYALGVILYELLAGRTPFVGNTYAVLVAQLLTAAPEPLQNLRPGLPAALVNAVHKALEKDPAKRFLTAEMFAASLPGDRTVSQIELAGTLDSGYAVARMPSGAQTTTRKSRAPIIAVVAALVLGIATAGVLIATQTGATKQIAQPEAPPKPPAVTPIDPPAAPVTGLLKVASQPIGAQVFVDGKPIGTAPLEVTLSTGKHDVRFELADYEPFVTTTEIDAGSNRFTGTLVAAKKSGSSSRPIASKPPTPAGARPATAGTGGTRPAPATRATDQPPSMVGPQKPEPDVRKPISAPVAAPVEEPKPTGTGKTNPYTAPKENPYKK